MSDLMKRLIPNELPITCKCGTVTNSPKLTMVGKSLRADCPTCGKYIKHVKQRSHYVTADLTSKIREWLPRLTDDDLVAVCFTASKLLDVRGLIGKNVNHRQRARL